MSNPYSGGTSGGPPSFTPSQSYRRPSYATVAAGTSGSPSRSLDSFSRPHSGTPTREREQERDRERERESNMSSSRGAGAGFQDERREERSTGPAGASASWAADSMRYGACSQHEGHAAFFRPSYLRTSRYVERLEQAYEAHLAEMQEYASRHPTRPSLSTSSSNVNLSKMHTGHVHRAPIQDVYERLPPPSAESELHQLPSRWSEDDKMSGLEIMADGTEVRFNGVTKTSDEAAAVRSDYPMPRGVGIYYFEVTILSRGKDGLIGIGFSGRKANLNRLPGWETDSWAYHGDDGYVFQCTASGRAYGPKFSSQDVIGCGVNFRTGEAFFTKNGVDLGKAFGNIKDKTLYPSVGMKKPGEHLRINFGKTPFVFDIDTMVDQERQNILAEISRTDVAGLHPPDDEDALIHNLISQYLVVEGYTETARAFNADIYEKQQSLSSQAHPLQSVSEDDKVNATNRQKIRKSILDGNIDQALKYITAYYPQLFEEEKNKDLRFRLQCRKFIELMRRYTELSTAASFLAPITKSVDSLASNGHAHDKDHEQEPTEPTDTQMEVDDQIQREASRPPAEDVDMDASQELSPKISLMKADQILTLAVKYGQDLNREFGKDPRPWVQNTLRDIFAVVAYANVSSSPMAHLFENQGRVELAEDVNGAVLLSLGKPSSAALETLSAQTEALLDLAADKAGGPAALINARRYFLRDV